MEKMHKLVPFGVSKMHVRYKQWSIDFIYGLRRHSEDVDEASVITLVLTGYEDVPYGRVFFPYDSDGCYPHADPSFYSIKMTDGNWRLTGKDEHPLATDTNKYVMVWMVK